jgi:serine/threonine protein kinase
LGYLRGLSDVEVTARDFVRRSPTPQPGERLTASMALDHPWLSTDSQTATIIVSQNDQRSNHSIPTDSAPIAISDYTRPLSTAINHSQSQYNYNTASHVGLLSNYTPEAAQNTIVRPAAVNHWPEADQRRMREPMPGTFVVERFDSPNSSEGPMTNIEDENESKVVEEPSSRDSKIFVDQEKSSNVTKKPKRYLEMQKLTTEVNRNALQDAQVEAVFGLRNPPLNGEETATRVDKEATTPSPDLDRFRRLLLSGAENHERRDPPSIFKRMLWAGQNLASATTKHLQVSITSNLYAECLTSRW